MSNVLAQDALVNSTCEMEEPMYPYPEEDELVSFFEVEPKIINRAVGLDCSILIFHKTFGEEDIYCEIDFVYGRIRFTWKRQSKPEVSLELRDIQSLELRTDKDIQALIAKFSQEGQLLDFELRLKPQIRVKLGDDVLP